MSTNKRDNQEDPDRFLNFAERASLGPTTDLDTDWVETRKLQRPRVPKWDYIHLESPISRSQALRSLEQSDPDKSYVDPLSSTKLTLTNLLTLVDKVSNFGFQLSTEEIFEMVLDLGLYLSHVNRGLYLNPDIHEHPADIPDVRGNVLMIHRQLRRRETQLISILGDTILDIASEFRYLVTEIDKHQEEIDKIDFQMGDFDLTETEDILKLRGLVLKLRKENSQLDRRNYFLDCLNKKLERKTESALAANKRALNNLSNFGFSSIVTSNPKMSKKSTFKPLNFSVVHGENGTINSNQENSQPIRTSSHSQTEFNFGDEKNGTG